MISSIPQSVTLVAASKTQAPQKIQSVLEQGITHFGENYLQEAIPKIEALKNRNITWHFIGSVQSRKCQMIAQYFDWVQTVDSYKIAQKLHNALDTLDRPILNICIQVNIDQDPQKSGIAPTDLMSFVQRIDSLSNLKLRGLMCIPKKTDNILETKNSFNLMKNLFDGLVKDGYQLDTLSMGMSSDYDLAIQAGSTMVRIGTAIFGLRNRDNLS